MSDRSGRSPPGARLSRGAYTARPSTVHGFPRGPRAHAGAMAQARGGSGGGSTLDQFAPAPAKPEGALQ
eukprot:4989281-Prymnesium_polylepis.1